MVLILSLNRENSTQQVIEWLTFMGVDWFRINETDAISIDTISLTNGKEPQIILNVNDRKLDLTSVTSYWYRRGSMSFRYQFDSGNFSAKLRSGLQNYLDEEKGQLLDFIHWYLKTCKRSLSGFYEADAKKLQYLVLAKRARLIIPESLITTRIQALSGFLSEQQDLITKSIHEKLTLVENDLFTHGYTSTVNPEDIETAESNAHFFPTLFQGHVRKLLELRIFFIEAELYAMAIFSQQNKQTETDFRFYDHERPNRNVPYKLPEDIAIKIQEFIKLSGLNTGSIDMILSLDHQYIFLEVNPVGQFGMTSKPCNYYLEEKIAKHLAYAPF